MIETLILGVLLGFIGTTAGAFYVIRKILKQPYIMKELSGGYYAAIIDKDFDGNPCGYIALKKDGDIIAAIKFDEKGVTDIVYDI